MEQKPDLIEKIKKSILPLSQLEDLRVDGLKPAAVLMPLVRENGEWKLLFIHRANSGEFHRGEVAFPGGAREKSDVDLVDTALRETFEELGIIKNCITVLGFIHSFSTISNYLVTPIVGVVDWPQSLNLDGNEVERAFTIPINWLMAESNRTDREFSMPNGVKRNTIFYEQYDSEILWGITARMTSELLDSIK
jgi:8-oxo-dGTP pyrophosphatase MutT (NUDIX family)